MIRVNNIDCYQLLNFYINLEKLFEKTMELNRIAAIKIS